MTTMVVGASGATGRLLVEQLLSNGECVKIIVRSKSNLRQAALFGDRRCAQAVPCD